ncbi:hypothetical protein GCM10011362_08670 [Marinobacter halophilus]|nr:hypothetical protein GCM10011362_08670 [Marinobacter halophilus]
MKIVGRAEVTNIGNNRNRKICRISKTLRQPGNPVEFSLDIMASLMGVQQGTN